VFDNPFDSFHKTVGKAKKEREQLDHLLTVSTPGELALVVLAAGVLLLFAAWLAFGSVARSVALEGVLVDSGERYPRGSSSLQAVVWLERDQGLNIDAGLPAFLEVTTTDGRVRSLEGTVLNLVAAPLSDGAAPFASTAPVTMHRLRIALSQGPEFASIEGRECRIVIELGSQSPLAFFARRPS